MQDSRFLHVSLNFFELSRLTIVLMALLIISAVLIGMPLPVKGESMEPNFHSGQLVFVERFNYTAKNVRRGDVVAARFPADPDHTKLIKRVLGLPGEKVRSEAGRIYINGQMLAESFYQPRLAAPPYPEIAELTLGPDQYFLAGDNRPGSSDSRLWGPVVSQDIEGRIGFILYPFAQAQYIDRVSY